MKAVVQSCDVCNEERMMVTLPLDEARMLLADLPADTSADGDLPTPMLDLFAKRLGVALDAAAPTESSPQTTLATTSPGNDEAGSLESGPDYLFEALGRPLVETPLQARTWNALQSAGLTVVADLVQKTEADLKQVTNLGDKSIEEIEAMLSVLGLCLGMSIDYAVLERLNRERRLAQGEGVP